jgi:hypothetical protein
MPLGLVDIADDFLAPAIRPRIIDGAHGAGLVCRQPARWRMLGVDQRQVVAEQSHGPASLIHSSATPLPAATSFNAPM